MDFRQEGGGGDSRRSDTPRVAGRVGRGGGGFPVRTVLCVVGAVTVVGGAAYYGERE